MSSDPEPDTPDAAAVARRKAAEAARVARIFGEVLPETTTDERGGDSRGGDSDEWLRSQVPPHHG